VDLREEVNTIKGESFHKQAKGYELNFTPNQHLSNLVPRDIDTFSICLLFDGIILDWLESGERQCHAFLDISW